MSVSGLATQTTATLVYSTGPCSDKLFGWTNPSCNQYPGLVTRLAPDSRCNATATEPAIVPCPRITHSCGDTSTSSSNASPGCGNDWTLGSMNNCAGGGPPQALCSQLDTSTCPTLAGVAPTSVQWAKAPQVQCLYPLDQLNNPNGVAAFTSSFTGTDAITSAGYQTLMSNYCSQQVDNCFGNLSSCSRVFENVANNPCLLWYEALKTEAVQSGNPTALDAWIAQYCGANTNSADCACSNAYLDPLYQGLINATQSVPSCWFVPCSGGAAQSQLQPSSVLANQFGNSPCPSDVCVNVQEFINSSGNPNNTFTQQLICGAGGGGGTGGSGGFGPSPTPGQPIDRNPLFWVGIGSLVLLLLVLLIAVLARKKGK